jgi:hypothetical protein
VELRKIANNLFAGRDFIVVTNCSQRPAAYSELHYRTHIRCSSEVGGSTFIRNVCTYLQVYGALQFRRRTPKFSLTWELQMPRN